MSDSRNSHSGNAEQRLNSRELGLNGKCLGSTGAFLKSFFLSKPFNPFDENQQAQMRHAQLAYHEGFADPANGMSEDIDSTLKSHRIPYISQFSFEKPARNLHDELGSLVQHTGEGEKTGIYVELKATTNSRGEPVPDNTYHATAFTAERPQGSSIPVCSIFDINTKLAKGNCTDMMRQFMLFTQQYGSSTAASIRTYKTHQMNHSTG